MFVFGKTGLQLQAKVLSAEDRIGVLTVQNV